MSARARAQRGLLPVPPLEPPPPWRVGPAEWPFTRPLVMGVLNVTPDSFSDGGRYLEPARALERARELEAEGADLIDVGGASSHPRAEPVTRETELARIAPVIERLAAEAAVPISVDTTLPAVAAACLELGAHLINDVSGLATPEMAQVCAQHDAPLVITHNAWRLPPRPEGEPLLESLRGFFESRIETATAAGVRRVLLDPGYGFGKTLEENLTLLRSLNGLRNLRRPVLICTSRKGSLGRITGEPDPAERLGATIATSLFAAFQGAAMVRVHDVKPFRQALEAWQAIKAAPRVL